MTSNDNDHAKYIRQMFGRIAPRYDLLNRLMTFGQDIRWRKEAVRHLSPPDCSYLLDLGAGTGDISLELKRQYPIARIIACDLTIEMIDVAKKRPVSNQVYWVIADAQQLPFANNVAGGVISGYLLRNVPDRLAALQEQFRVAAPGSRMIALDTTPPQPNFLKPLITLYLKMIIPFVGRLITGDAEAYAYLPRSTQQFLSAESLAQKITQAGFQNVGFVRRMFGTMAIHWGTKPDCK